MHQRFSHKLAVVSVLVSVGIVLGYFENVLFPQGIAFGVKIGFSNIVVVFALMYLGFNVACLIAVLKSVLSSILFMSLSAFFYSLSGVILSVLIMYILKRSISPDKISIIGISIAGSSFFNIGQILIACIYTKSFSCIYMLTYMLPLSVLTGACIGLIVMLVINRLKRRV